MKIKIPTKIRVNGVQYRLAGPEDQSDSKDTVAPEAPTDSAEPRDDLSVPDVAVKESDDRALSVLCENVVTKAKAILSGMQNFADTIDNREKAEAELDQVKHNIDGLMGDFRLLSGKYSAYAKQHLV